MYSSTLQYSSYTNHKCYSGITNTSNIYSSGNASCTGSISYGTTSHIYAGGLRISGFYNGNTIWQARGNFRISANPGNNIPFALGNGNIITTITASGITF